MSKEQRLEEETSASNAPDEFLATLGQKLLNQENGDAGLAGILAIHLLTAAPAKDAVPKAKAAILKLATDRANTPTSEALNV